MSNLIVNDPEDHVLSEYEPPFDQTKSIDEVLSIMNHMIDSQLFLMNERGMVFNTSKIKDAVINLKESYDEYGAIDYFSTRLLTRQHNLRQTVISHLTGV
jgi:hypothetical protein